MRWWQWTAAATIAVLTCLWHIAPSQTDEIAEGRNLYLRHCSVCHGKSGKGDGPLAKFVNPPVPDLTEGVFKFRSTPSGTLPTDEDLKRVISEGVPSTPMMGVKGVLSESQINAVVAFVKTLCPDFSRKGSGSPIKINPPEPTPELLRLGRQIYEEFQCHTCHGLKGDGDGPMAKTLKDNKGRPIRLLSFRDARNFKGGYSPSDIYRSIMTGLDGTPMASFAEVLTEEEGWAVAYFVHSLIARKTANPRSNLSIRVGRFGKLSPSLKEPAWSKVPVFSLPLQSLWRANNPESVGVQAATDGQRLVFRFMWDDTTYNSKGNRLDGIAVQIPQKPENPVPSLFWGDQQSPVLVFRWFAGRKLEILSAKGLGSLVPQPYGAAVQSLWQKGRWTVVLQVPLPKGTDRLPFAVSVWEASAGDSGERRSITGWHWLEIETSNSPQSR